MGPFAKEAMFLQLDKSIVYWFGFAMKLPCFRNEIIDVGRDCVAYIVKVLPYVNLARCALAASALSLP